MNGPGHYAEAERLLRQAHEQLDYKDAGLLIAEAQVEATLALAAATALTACRVDTWQPAVIDEWVEVTSS